MSLATNTTAIQKLLNKVNNMPTADEVYDQGFDAGKQAEQDAFWEVFQKGGKEMSYQHAFSQGRFTDENYNPKYPLRFSSTSSVGGQYVFYGSPITDTKVDIIAGKGRAITSCFQNTPELHTIRKLVLDTNTFSNTFSNCTSLRNIVIEGEITNDFDIHWSPLSKDSIESIVNALSTTTSEKILQLSETAVDTAFKTSQEPDAPSDGSDSQEWLELAGTK